MAIESSYNTFSTTLTDKLDHPVKEFLTDCGVDVTNFPRVQLLVEVDQAIFKNTQLYIPLRIPGRPGVVFETYCRIIRVTEVPKLQSSGHRTFVELEWLIEEHPLLEAEHHAVFSFLSGEIECPSCKHSFAPEPAILDDRSVKVSCHNCMHYWTIKVDSPSLNLPNLKLLTDSFYKDPSKIQKSMAEWDQSQDSRDELGFFDYFPVEFETTAVDGSLELLFGEREAYQIQGGNCDSDFELLSKALINFLAFHYFRRPAESRYSSKLEKTDICRKSEVQFKEESRRKLHAEFFPTREFETIKTTPSDSPFQGLHTGDTKIHEMKWSTLNEKARPEARGHMALFASVAASLFLLSGIGVYFWTTRSIPEATQVAVAEELPQKTLTETPKPKVEKVEKVEAKAEPIAIKPEVKTPVAAKPVVKKEEAKPEAQESVVAADLPEKQAPVQVAAIAKPESRVVVEPEANSKARNIAKMALVDAGYRQGMLHLKLQQAKEAASEFERVIELDPRHTDSYRNLGLAYVYDRRFEEAIGAFEKYLSLAGESEDRNSVEELLETLKDRVSISEASQ